METKFYVPLEPAFTTDDIEGIAGNHFEVFYTSEVNEVKRNNEKELIPSFVLVITTYDQTFEQVLPFLSELTKKLGHSDVRVVATETIGGGNANKTRSKSP